MHASQESDPMSVCDTPMIEIHDYSEPEVVRDTSEKNQRPVTAAEFEFCLSRVDEKINSLYRMCVSIEERQKEILKGIKKLVAIDELSDGFWKVLKYFEF